jgi:DNA invertase Pin-like site-specific DNA recombinase
VTSLNSRIFPTIMARQKKPTQARSRYWVGYCRKSTDSEDKQVHTLQDQAALIRAHYDRLPLLDRDGSPLQLLEEACSAYHPGRPVFDAILRKADRGEVRGVIVVHPNRVSRNHADSGAFVQRLVDGQIGSLDTTGGKRYTGADSNDIFMLTLEGAMSWKDSRDKGDRILQAMRMRAVEGRHMGPVRLGYRVVYRPDGSRVLEIVPELAGSIRRLFDLAAAGAHSTQDLADEAWRLGLRSRAGKKLFRSAIHAMLRDPLYKGHIRFDGIEAKGVHEPMIDENVWNQVQWVLTGRRKETARPKDLTVRDLFVFGNLLRCPGCGRSLCPYRAKKKYVYYECKNLETKCGVCISQAVLVQQLPDVLNGAFLDHADLDRLRVDLLRRHRGRIADDSTRRRTLNAEYEAVQTEIGEVFAQRKEAAALGIRDAVDLRLAVLKRKRDELHRSLNLAHDKGSDWIDQVVRAFELVSLLQEAILFGSRPTRETTLNAIASNFTVVGKELILKLRSPFHEGSKRHDRPTWWADLYDVRTEIEETVCRLEKAFLLIQDIQSTSEREEFISGK